MNEMARRIARQGARPRDPDAAEPEAPRQAPRPLRPGPFGVLDIGSTKIACVIGRTDGDGRLRVLGFGWQRSRGVRGGGITDIEEAERAIRTAVAHAEDMADHHLRSVTVNLSCGQPESRLMNVQWPVGGRVVTEPDIRRVVAEGRSRAHSDGRETIHVLPLAFAVDETGGVDDPRGLHCEHLTARLHVVDGASGALRNLANAVARCDLDIAEVVSAPLAAGLSTLVEDERELGSIVVDMGGGMTGIGVFAEGGLVHSAQLPVGGEHLTSEIARLLSTTRTAAERLKTLYGNAQPSPDDERELLHVPMVGEDEDQYARVPRSMVVNIIRPRLVELFELVRDRLEGAGLGRTVEARVVLTGGASQLVGTREMAAHILGRQVRLGRPANLRGLPDTATGPGFATAAGLLAWAAGDGRRLPDIDFTAHDAPRGLVRRIVAFLRERV